MASPSLFFKHSNQQSFWLSVIVDTAVLAALAVAFLVVARIIQPQFGTVQYQFEGGEVQEGTLPISIDAAGSNLSVSVPFNRTLLSPTVFVLRADDCLEELKVNGVTIEVSQSCYEDGWVAVDLSRHLHTGSNTMQFKIRTSSGNSGMSIGPSLTDPLHLALLLSFLFVCSLYALRWMQRLHAPRSAWLLLLLLAFGLLLRLYLSPAAGYASDITINQGWAQSAAELGFARSYSEQVNDNMLPNYPPFSLGIFGIVGKTYQVLFGTDLNEYAFGFHVLIKLPGMLADLATAVLLFIVFRRWRSERIGLLAAAAYIFHPAVLYNSAVWGQVDSVYTLFIIAALIATSFERWVLTGVLIMLALLTKMQAIIVIPFLAAFALSNSRILLQMAAGGAVACVLVLLPFMEHDALLRIWDVYVNSVGFYDDLSYGAYNPWYSLYEGSDRSDLDLWFGILSYRRLGLLLFAGITAALFLRIMPSHVLQAQQRKKFPELLLLFSALIAYAFFLFNTEMHERYLFPILALGLPLLFMSVEGAVLYIAASLLFLLNLLGVLPWTELDSALFREFTGLESFIGTAHLVVFFGWIGFVIRHVHPASLKQLWFKK